MKGPGFLTFDCYGTLVDWENGIVQAFSAALGAAGAPLDRARLLADHARLEPAIQAGGFRPYREVLAEVARRIAAERGRPDVDPGFLAASLPGWPVFPDTVSALQALRAAGFRLGILSNVDEDLLAGTLARLPVPFDLVVTAERVRSYKPARAHFDAAREAIGDATWLHAAQSLFHDVAPCNALGIRVAWIDRQGEGEAAAARAGARPDARYPDLAALAARVA